jgi:hypothetical protein
VPGSWAGRRLTASATALALLAAGCASSSAAGSASPGGFRSAYGAVRPHLRVLEADLRAQLLDVRGLTPAAVDQRAYALSVAANNQASTVGGLQAPARDNTRLRDLHAALLALVNDLSAVAAAAGHSGPATAAAEAQVRVETGHLGVIDARLAQALGLKPD